MIEVIQWHLWPYYLFGLATFAVVLEGIKAVELRHRRRASVAKCPACGAALTCESPRDPRAK